jgi:hypothetical protein
MFTKAGKTGSTRSTTSLRTKLTMLAAGAAASVALMTTAAPAMAQEYPSPDGSSGERTTLPAPPPEEGLDVSSAAFGALAGISLAAAGLGITIGVQRRRDQRAVVPTV